MNWSLLLHFVRQDLIDRHAGSALGALWTLLLPLATILIFTLVFSRVMGARLEGMGVESFGPYGYSIYLVTALLAWNCFAQTLTRITQVFHEKAGLLGKVRISLFSLPLYVLISETIMYLVSMAFFMVFLYLIGFKWNIHWLWWPLIFVIQQLLAYSIGLMCAILSVFLRDIKEVVSVVTQLWFWLTPIVYVITILPEEWAGVLAWNPAYHITHALRETMLMGRAPEPFGLAVIALLGAVLLAAVLFVGKKLERDIRDFL